MKNVINYGAFIANIRKKLNMSSNNLENKSKIYQNIQDQLPLFHKFLDLNKFDLNKLLESDEVFITNSLFGVLQVKEIKNSGDENLKKQFFTDGKGKAEINFY